MIVGSCNIMKHVVKRTGWFCLLLLVGMSLATLPGCGSKTKVESLASVGQELQDLEDARNKGLITESEYNKHRQ